MTGKHDCGCRHLPIWTLLQTKQRKKLTRGWVGMKEEEECGEEIKRANRKWRTTQQQEKTEKKKGNGNISLRNSGKSNKHISNLKYVGKCVECCFQKKSQHTRCFQPWPNDFDCSCEVTPQWKQTQKHLWLQSMGVLCMYVCLYI